jgi:hypothetical protein
MPKPVFSYDILQGLDIRTYPQAFLPVPQGSCLGLHLLGIGQTNQQKNRLPLQNMYITVPYLDNNPIGRNMQRHGKFK